LVSSKRSSELVSGALKKPASTDAAPTMAYAGADATLPPTSQSGGVVSHPRGLRRKRERFLSSPHTSPFLKSENIFKAISSPRNHQKDWHLRCSTTAQALEGG
jgi:hypothetical protein